MSNVVSSHQSLFPGRAMRELSQDSPESLFLIFTEFPEEKKV